MPAVLHDDVSEADLVHIANDSKAAVIFVAQQPVSDRSVMSQQFLSDRLVQNILPQLPHCQHVVLLPSDSYSDAGALQRLDAEAHALAGKFDSKSVAPGEQPRKCGFHSWAKFETAPHEPEDAFVRRTASILSDSCCCVCYGSSASRTLPVGSMLSHDNVLWSARVFSENYLRLEAGNAILLTMPIAFALSQVVYIAASIQIGATVFLPSAQSGPYDVKLSSLRETQPHVLICTPAQWQSLLAEIEKLPLVAHASSSSKEMGKNGGRAAAMGQPKPRFYGWNRRQVFSKIWADTGLARCKFLGCYGDLCPPQVVDQLMSMGMCLCNVYGCNEASGIIASTLNDPLRPQLPLANEWKAGHVGRCIPGCEVQLIMDPQQSGRVTFRGRNTFMGYLNRPTVATAGGYFDTGDWGSVNNALLDIHGRNSDRFVLAMGGPLFTPDIEAVIQQSLPGVSRAVLFGHGLPHVSLMCEFHQDTKYGSVSDACIAWQRQKGVNPISVTTHEALSNQSFLREVTLALQVIAAVFCFCRCCSRMCVGNAQGREVQGGAHRQVPVHQGQVVHALQWRLSHRV